MEMNNRPLVSVPVITYNSAKFVLETLESIKAQTYQNIELIISDDCSTDNTVELCQKWVEENKERFVRIQIITSELNTGVSANLNRAEAACQGVWVKGIAGDDLLMPDCVGDCIDYVINHPDCYYLFGRIKAFGANEEYNQYVTEYAFEYAMFSKSSEDQLKKMIYDKNFVPGVTCFYNRRKNNELEITNDERIPMLEDWPKWICILNKGISLNFMDKTIVMYRIHNSSLSTADKLSTKFIHSHFLFDLYYRFPVWQQISQDYAVQRISKSYLEILENMNEEINNLKSQTAANSLFLPSRIKKKIQQIFLRMKI